MAKYCETLIALNETQERTSLTNPEDHELPILINEGESSKTEKTSNLGNILVEMLKMLKS